MKVGTKNIIVKKFGIVKINSYLCITNLKQYIMSVEQALKELKENGANITKIEDNKFIVVDNGFFGFSEEEEPFIIDSDELFEIHEQYIG